MSEAATGDSTGADAAPRVLVVWCPDWPIQAAVRDASLTASAPIALIEKGFVHACSTAARADGVRRGLRVREAQARCPTLVVQPYNPAQDARHFEPVLQALEAGVPTVQVVRPGMVVARAQGPARYYGGEQAAAQAILRQVAGLVDDVRVGVANGAFTAEQAARRATQGGAMVVPPGAAAAFLAPLSVSLLGLPQLAALLARLGVRTLADFARLDAGDVLDRFGPQGAAAHLVAAGRDPRRVVPRVAERDRTRTIHFEPPLENIEQIAFTLRQTAEAFVAGLIVERLVCTALTVEATDERGGSSTRTWLHPRSFTPLDVIDRVRWQVQGAFLESPVASVRLLPEALDTAAHHEQGLWGGGPDERIHHALSRVQSMLGHDAVVTASVGGGRLSADRRVLVPWGERPIPERAADRPWPGRLPGFEPPRVFPDRIPVTLLDAAGASLTIDDRDALSNPPRTFIPPAARGAVVRAWAGPWPIEERWWNPTAGRSVHRLQIVTADESAWLLQCEHDTWWAEARYD
ncbi:DNA polymerase Y family protein [uncultured Amnibacterium sp.]|uniref:DNA polymerase Y family protein n=1 Tax=uncultured Amnibacterium sp. TaxID=1631851 RepID=UPI0035CC5B29